MSVVENDTEFEPRPAEHKGHWQRLNDGETAIDFYGRRWLWLTISIICVLITIVSLFVKDLNLGLEFEGGVSWDVPAANFTVDEARGVVDDAGLDGGGARVQEVTAQGEDRIKIQVQVPSDDDDENQRVRSEVRDALAEAAGVNSDDVSVQAVSASWGETVTKQAVKALIVFIALVMIFIAIRFEMLMAIAAIIAMMHDVLISVGIYSVFGLVVTPATVIAFLTILGFSLYDTIVVFDKVRENRARYAGSHLGYPDITNISMNQVLMRSLNTSIAAVLPVISLLVVGTWILGVETLREFSLALLIGMIIGVYSSIFIATPLLAMIREPHQTEHATGEELRRLVRGGSPGGKRRTARLRRSEATTGSDLPAEAAAIGADEGEETVPARRRGSKPSTPRPVVDATPETLLQHAPRPRKKKRH
jgi:preprotein translocase subunit SecF